MARFITRKKISHMSHLLALDECESGIVLTQAPVKSKENEISASAALLHPVLVKGRIISTDAMQTQKKWCAGVDASDGSYLVVVKKNQPGVHQDLVDFFADKELDGGEWEYEKKVQKGHGRREVREIWTRTQMNAFFEREWAGIAQILKIRRSVERAGKEHEEMVYGFTNLPRKKAGAKRLLELNQKHWAIENRLHSRRDVTLGEDACQVRIKGAPQALAALNGGVLALMDWLGVTNVASQMRHFCAQPQGRLYPKAGQKTKGRVSCSQNFSQRKKEEMLTLPKRIRQVLRHFETVFSERVWEWAKVLVIGAILAPGERTVAAILPVMGCSDDKQFQNSHRVLNRASWSSRELSRRLLGLLVRLFVPGNAPVLLGMDETIERRRGRQMAARGVYRDPVRSSKEFFVKTQGLRGISLMLLTPIPWACRVWALPFLSVLAPSERSHEPRKRRHKTITDWAWQMILPVSRWMPARRLVVVADGTSAVLDFLLKVSRLPRVRAITRLRLDACLYDPAPAREAGKRGRKPLKGKPQPKLAQRLLDPKTVWQKQTLSWYGGTTRAMEIATGTALWDQSPVPPVAIRWVLIRDPEGKYEPVALLCTDQNAQAVQIVEWFVLRWTVEVTFHEVRAHLGVQTQRQWSDLAIVRTPPALLGLFSLVTVFAHELLGEQPFPVRQAAWYSKALPTFSDTLADLHQHLWPSTYFSVSSEKGDTVQIPRVLFDRLVDTLAFAA